MIPYDALLHDIKVRTSAGLSQVTSDDVAEAERLIGAPFPTLLRRLYLEVGNGGFGPGLGLLGLAGGHTDDLGRCASDIHASHGQWPGRPEHVWALCHWGCAIYSFVHCPSGRIFGWDPNVVEPEDDVPFFEQQYTLETWLAAWLDGSLRQPWLLFEDGDYRGATVAETESAHRGSASDTK
ncbi:hypothetical protein GCM10027417_28060 [Glutamicibacter endophyticus]